MLSPAYISAIYIRGTSEQITRVLKHFDRNVLCHLKYRRIVNDRSVVTYGLDCNNCSAMHVSETKRQVKDR